MTLNASLSFPSSFDASPAAGDLIVRRFELREAMSELFELTVEALSTDPTLAEAAFVGKAVTVGFGDEPFVKEIRGIVRRMEQRTAVPGGSSLYAWTVVPPVWLATRRRDCRIFQHKSVPEIVDAVLADRTYAGRIDAPTKLLGDHARREYVVQYDETDWEFLCRILADDGIASFFDHTNGSAWTLVDDTSIAATDLVAGPIRFSEAAQMTTAGTPHVQTAVIASCVETSAVTVRDYDFEKPEFVLEAKHEIDRGAAFANEAGLEAYGYEVGKFAAQAPGDARAAALLEAARSPRRRILCTASFALPPGMRMSLVDHPRDDVNAAFLVVRAHTVMEADGLGSHELELLDLAIRFRPAHLPKRRIHGTQTAFVVGADGEEIDVDKYGRVEVDFRWDRRDQHAAGITRRVRVAQGWAGAGFGLVMLPRVNEEVIVAYLDGDPDQPIIVGRVHNALATTPLSLPGEKTVSVWRSKSSPKSDGYNEIRIDDKAGAERFEMHAQRDFKQVVGHDAETTIVGDEKRTVKGKRDVQVVGNQSDKVRGDKNIDVKGALDLHGKTISIVADTTMRLYSGAHMQVSCGTNRDDYTTGNHAIEADALFVKGRSGVQVVAPQVHVFGGNEIHLQVGGSSIHITAGGIKIASAGAVEVNGSVVKLNC
jgi:type VI secretion system secreted protein VgrG